MRQNKKQTKQHQRNSSSRSTYPKYAERSDEKSPCERQTPGTNSRLLAKDDERQRKFLNPVRIM